MQGRTSGPDQAGSAILEFFKLNCLSRQRGGGVLPAMEFIWMATKLFTSAEDLH